MVNVNTVYTTVLSILNKEQRGYVTPDEFNRLATQVQLEIFESYFPDGTQLNRQNQNNTQNDTEFFNIFKNQEEKLFEFQKAISFSQNATSLAWSQTAAVSPGDYVANIYWMGDILSTYSSSLVGNTDPKASSSGGQFVTQLVNKKDYNKITRSKLTAPTYKFPIAFASTPTTTNNIDQVGLTISPTPSTVEVNCVVTPRDPSWAFIVGIPGQYIFNGGTAVNFQLHISEQTNIIIGILKYAGVIINDPTIIDVAAQEAAQVQANEKS
tara:strand:- start:378 stop:1181 length:804 start_codon:yes stop_codon:yes gene_type:complete